MYESGILFRVKQFGLEVHTMTTFRTTLKIFFDQYKTLERLESFGFRRWYWHFNFWGTYMYKNRARSCCYELVYINTNFMSKTTSKPTLAYAATRG